MISVSSAIAAGALAAFAVPGAGPVTTLPTEPRALLMANLSESESFAEYRRLLAEQGIGEQLLPPVASERPTRSRRLRLNPLLVGVSR